MIRSRERSRGRGRELGQAAVELALALPVVVLVLLLVVQAGLVVIDQVAVVQAAREAARAAAVDPAPGVVRAALRRTRLEASRSQASERREPGPPATVTVVVRYRAPTDVPLIGPLVPDVPLEAEATMAVESP